MYSVDQDGYYTSMHRDSGLARGQHSNDSHVPGSTPTSAHCIVKSKKNPFFMTNTHRTGSEGTRGKPKKTPPPPPPRVSTILDKSTVSKSVLNGDAHSADSGSMRKGGERVSVHPSTRTMSPISSDMEEDYALQWGRQASLAQTGIKSTMSAPGCLSSYAPRGTITASIAGAKMDCIAEVSNESSADQSYSSVDDSMLPRYQCRHNDNTSEGYSTWPRSPRNVAVANKDQAEGILKNGTSSKHRPPQMLNFAPTVNVFDENNKPAGSRDVIPKVCTPDNFLAEKQGFIATDNSFRDTPSNDNVMKSGMLLSKETPNSDYQHCVTVSPRVRQHKDHHARQNMSVKTAPLHRAPSFQSQSDVSHEGSGSCDSDHTSTWPRLRRPRPGETSQSALVVTPTEPVAAPAQLIISSPMGGRAEFVENPHKRVLCSPVTTEDLIAFSMCSSPKCHRVPAMNPVIPQTTASHLYHSGPPGGITVDSSPTVNEIPSSIALTQCSAFKPVSVPLFPSLSAMKHSIPFPVPDSEKPVERTAVTKSWYDGMHTRIYENPLGEHNEVLRTSLLKDSADGGVTMRPRRDSNSSTMSTHSSSSSRRSVTFATVHRSSSSSLVMKLDHAVSSSLLCVPELTSNVGVKRSRSTCSSSSGSESSWRHKYTPLSVRPGVAPPTLPTFTSFAKPEPEAKRIRVGMETRNVHKPAVHETVVTEAYHFQMAPAVMCFTGSTSLQQPSLAGNAQTCNNQKVKPKVPQRNCSFKEVRAESEQLPLDSCVFAAAPRSHGQPTTTGQPTATSVGQPTATIETSETFTLTDNTFVRSYAPPKFVVPKRAASSGGSVTDNTCCDNKTSLVENTCTKSNAVNNECIQSIHSNMTNGHAGGSTITRSSSVTENGSCVSRNDIATGEISHKMPETTYSAKLAFLSKNVPDARSADRRLSEHQLGLSASCSSLHQDCGGARVDRVVLGTGGNHVSSMQGLCQGQTDPRVPTGGDIKGKDQLSSCQLVSPAVSSLSSSGLGSSVASSPDSRPNSPDLTDTSPCEESELGKQSGEVCCKT